MRERMMKGAWLAPEGSVIAMQITTPNGETLETNLKITASDLELVQQLKKMR